MLYDFLLKPLPMSIATILVVDDDRSIQQTIKHRLTKEGYTVSCVGSGEEVPEAIAESKPDLILLDLVLPEKDGIQVCRELKEQNDTSDIGIIMLSSNQDENLVLTALELGAEDFVVKPFSPDVLVSKIKKYLSRAHSANDNESENSYIHSGDLEIDPEKHIARRRGETLSLTPTEVKILETLIQSTGIIQTNRQVIKAAENPNSVNHETLCVFMNMLSNKLTAHSHQLEKIVGIGYLWRD